VPGYLVFCFCFSSARQILISYLYGSPQIAEKEHCSSALGVGIVVPLKRLAKKLRSVQLCSNELFASVKE
jgi:hypothetical protein